MAQKDHAFGLPAGSVRALLALTVFAGIWVLLVKQPTVAVPAYLQNLMFIIMGHYFAARRPKPTIDAEDVYIDPVKATVAIREKPEEPHPLYLPQGTIRFLLIGGFVTVAVLLGRDNQLWMNGSGLSQAGVSLLLVFGFIVGVLRSYMFKQRRWLEDLRATFSLAAGVALILVIFGFLKLPHFENNYNFHEEEILAACVGFYFGSKS